MTKIEIVTLLLSSAVISGVITTVLTYWFDGKKNDKERIFQIKKEAYVVAIDAISGFSETIFDYMIKKHSIDSRINPIIVTEFIAAYTRKISSAVLVTNENIRKLLKQIPPLIIECAELVETLTKSAEKTEGGFVINSSSSEANKLKNWKEKIGELEDQIVIAMREDLGLSD